jgi:hypothetical protein
MAEKWHAFLGSGTFGPYRKLPKYSGPPFARHARGHALHRSVQIVAVSRSRDRDTEHAARRLRLPGRVLRRWNSAGLDLIARGLRRDGLRIF